MSSRPNRLEKKRDQRKKRRLRLGGYLIITDAKETEANYFKGFVASIPDQYSCDLQVKIFADKKLKSIIDFAEKERNKDPRFRNIWLVFDKDEVSDFDDLINDAQKLGMGVGWSNPCFEVWLSAHFNKSINTSSSVDCCSRFSSTFSKLTNGREYSKSDNELFKIVNHYGDEKQAITMATKKHENAMQDYCSPSDMVGCTTVYQVVKEIREKTNSSTPMMTI